MLLVQAANEIAHLAAEDALHRPLLGRHDVYLDATRTQRGSNLEPDKARAHHDGSTRRLRALDDRAAIGERAQRVDVRQVDAG